MKNPIFQIHSLCYITAALLSSLGFLSQRLWTGLVFVIVLGLSGCLPKRFRANWTSVVRLAGFLLIAIAGLFAGASPFLLIAGVIFALAGHETETLIMEIPESSIHSSTKTLMKRHLSWVGIACLASLLICTTGLMLRIKVSFGLLVLIVISILFVNYRLMLSIKRFFE